MCKAVQQDDGVLLGDRLLVNVDAHGEGLLVPTIVPSTPNGLYTCLVWICSCCAISF